MVTTTGDRLPITAVGSVLWPLALAAVALIGSLAFACIFPFVAIAVACAATMRGRDAVATVVALWAINQAVGFTLMGYQHDASTYAWGIAIGLASIASVVIAMPIVGVGRPLTVVRLVAAFGAAFVAYEGLLFGFALFAGGLETFSADIVGLIARNDAMWFAGLMLLRLALTGVAPRWFGNAPSYRFA